MGGIAYYNGELFDRNEARIPLSDRAVFFGDAVYDMMIGEGGNIHQAEEHIARLLFGANTIGIKHRYSAEDIYDLLELVVKSSSLNSYRIYIQLSRDSASREHSYLSSRGTNILITAEEYRIVRDIEEIKLISTEDKRYRFCNVKTVNLLPAVLASAEAEKAGCDEAVFIRDGSITECAHSNISILLGDTVYTHPLSDVILPGITRRHLLLGALSSGFKCREERFGIGELFRADEVIVTSTTKLLRRATHVDGAAVGGRNLSAIKAFHDFLLNEYDKKIP